MGIGLKIKEYRNKAGLTQKEAGLAFDAYVNAGTNELKAGNKVTVPGFGTYEVKTRAARTGINPATKQEIKIPACKTPVFKFGKSYKDQF